MALVQLRKKQERKRITHFVELQDNLLKVVLDFQSAQCRDAGDGAEAGGHVHQLEGRFHYEIL